MLPIVCLLSILAMHCSVYSEQKQELPFVLHLHNNLNNNSEHTTRINENNGCKCADQHNTNLVNCLLNLPHDQKLQTLQTLPTEQRNDFIRNLTLEKYQQFLTSCSADDWQSFHQSLTPEEQKRWPTTLEELQSKLNSIERHARARYAAEYTSIIFGACLFNYYLALGLIIANFARYLLLPDSTDHAERNEEKVFNSFKETLITP